MKEDIQQLTQSCTVCKELNPKARTNPNIDPEQPKTDLGPFESVGLNMFYLVVVDRMSGYIMVENLAKSALCRTVTQKFKLLCLTYGHPRQVRYDKGPQFGKKFVEFLEFLPELGAFVISDLSWIAIGKTKKFKLLCDSSTQSRFSQILDHDVSGHPVYYKQVTLALPSEHVESYSLKWTQVRLWVLWIDVWACSCLWV